METLSDERIPLRPEAGNCISKTSSVIAAGRKEEVWEQAVVSGPTNSMSTVIMASLNIAAKCSIVSSLLFFVCRSSLIQLQDQGVNYIRKLKGDENLLKI